MSRFACNFVVLLCVSCGFSTPLLAQVFEIGGGNSSLYQAGGGSITMHAPSYDFTIGAGTANGHLLEGAQLVKATAFGKYIVGDDRINFRLPTDIFDTSHYLLARGAGFSRLRNGNEMLAFAGATSVDYNSPFFNGAKTNDPAGVLFLRRILNSKWQLFSDTIASKKVTEIAALQWEPMPKMDVAFSAGVGANQPYAAGSLNLSRRKIDLQAAYIQAGQQFHRIAVVSPLLAEPDRENILVVFKPSGFLTFTGGHQNYLVPQYPSTTNVHSAVDQGSTSLHIFGTQLSGTVYHSTYEQLSNKEVSNHAAAFTASRDFTSRLRLSSSYLASRPKGSSATNSFIATLSEVLTSRITVNESVTNSNGQNSVNFGGQFLSNFITFSANYETFYVPANNSKPFEQALLLDVKLKLFGRLMLHGASFVDPTGKLRYTADASTVLTHGKVPGPLIEHVAIGNYILHGCVVDTEGVAVEGAALLVDEKPIYTDSQGCFYMRESKPRTHKLSVVLSEFLANGNWQIVSMPSTITSAAEQSGAETTVVVVVRRVRNEAVKPGAPTVATPAATGGGLSLK